MAVIKARNQAELDAALKRAKLGDIVACIGSDYFSVAGSATVEAWDSATVRASDSATVRASGSATVEAWGSATVRASDSATVRASGSATVRAWGSATVEAWDSATVRAWDSATVRAWGSATVEAWGSATVRASGSATVRASGSATVEAWDSATVRASDSATVRASGSATVEAWGSATVRASDSATVRASGSATVRAWGSATVEAWGSATVRASKYVAIHVDRRYPHNQPTISGGVLIEIPPITTAADWCELYGLDVVDGLVTLYKAVDDEYTTPNARRAGIHYRPGTTVEAPDWDPKPECGGGLHFSPRPRAAREFQPAATKYVACPVRLDEIVVHSPADYPGKVKAPRVVGPIVEVDIDGEPVGAALGTLS